MTTYNTGNPVGSADPKDFYDNAENLDLAINGTGDMWLDRLGVSRKSLAGYNKEVQAIVNEAATSASEASTSEQNALASEQAAALSESNASASASAALTSEQNALASEQAAALSESNAATSEANALASEQATASLYDQFDDRYLGSKADNPTVDNDGNTLIEGALYWNYVAKVMRVWDGTIWKDITIPDYGTASTANIGTASGEVIGTDEANNYYDLQYKPSVAPTMSSDFCANEHKRYEQYGLEPKTLLQQWGVARNSTATYFDANGVLQTAGINEPRIDYDPATGECRGLLVEPQATRLNLYPTQFDNAGWGKLNGDTVLQNSSIAPDGTLAAYKIVSSTAGGYHGVRQIVTLQPGFYVISCYFKKSDYRYGWISDNAFSRFRAAFDLDTGLVTQLEGSVNCGAVSATVEPVVGGFFRFSIVIECFSADLSIGYSFYGASVGSSTLIGGAYYTGDGISGIYIWGAQLEQGSKPTSLILGDESAQVTRVADIITPTV